MFILLDYKKLFYLQILLPVPCVNLIQITFILIKLSPLKFSVRGEKIIIFTQLSKSGDVSAIINIKTFRM